MASSKTALTMVRSLALVGAIIVFAFGIWSLVIIRDIDNRGENVLDSFQTRLVGDATSWSQFIAAAAHGVARTWILVVASSITTLAILLVTMSNRHYWLRIPSAIVVFVEFTATISSIAISSCSLSVALSIRAFSTPPYVTLDSADLAFFALLDPLSRTLAITSALTSAFLIITCTGGLISLHKRHRQKKDVRSFEPTISALGMNRGFYAVYPPPNPTHDAIPTMYDPYRAFRKEPRGPPNAKQVAFTSEGAWMSRKHSRWKSKTGGTGAARKALE
ncbi:hypothetical protein ST47_g6557 [Ascochyta rabiei]|uniref:Uncharacterized protein n=1 Tax=Didymella rabiei TaxID=5454 RepID=A0A163C974_DIDRA|nr:hypothetical protein ST47_g6557 [Ascochyta rabiei]